MRAMLRWVAMGAGLLLVVTAGLGLAAYRRFSGNIRTDRAAERVLARYAGTASYRPSSSGYHMLVMRGR